MYDLGVLKISIVVTWTQVGFSLQCRLTQNCEFSQLAEEKCPCLPGSTTSSLNGSLLSIRTKE